MKPVAWMDDGHGSAEFAFSFEKGINHTIPLYTAPKELSDEEIDLFTKQFFNIWIGAELSEQFRIKLYELEEFARAILKKASEK